MDLTDEQREMVRPLMLAAQRPADGRGTPRANDFDVLNGMLWIMRTGAPCHGMPDRYSPYHTAVATSRPWFALEYSGRLSRAGRAP
jgi:transposase